jgi:hypothetical protein
MERLSPTSHAQKTQIKLCPTAPPAQIKQMRQWLIAPPGLIGRMKLKEPRPKLLAKTMAENPIPTEQIPT